MKEIDKIIMACELRRRAYMIDMANNPESDYFRGCYYAIFEFLGKLQDMKYIENYIEMKSAKYMSDKEKEEWSK